MSRPPIDSPLGHVLFLESSPEYSRSLVRAFDRVGLAPTHVETQAEAIVAVQSPHARFDVAVLRHEVVGGDTMEVLDAIEARGPLCSTLVLSKVRSRELALQYRNRGAFRFVTTPFAEAAVIAATLETFTDTQRWRGAGRPRAVAPMPPVVSVDIDAATERLAYIGQLSPAETAVAYWMLQGLRDAQIADRLGRAERTAKRHVGQVLCKTGAQNRSSLWAILREDSNPRVAYHCPPNSLAPAVVPAMPGPDPQQPVAADDDDDDDDDDARELHPSDGTHRRIGSSVHRGDTVLPRTPTSGSGPLAAVAAGRSAINGVSSSQS